MWFLQAARYFSLYIREWWILSWQLSSPTNRRHYTHNHPYDILQRELRRSNPKYNNECTRWLASQVKEYLHNYCNEINHWHRILIRMISHSGSPIYIPCVSMCSLQHSICSLLKIATKEVHPHANLSAPSMSRLDETVIREFRHNHNYA